MPPQRRLRRLLSMDTGNLNCRVGFKNTYYVIIDDNQNSMLIYMFIVILT